MKRNDFYINIITYTIIYSCKFVENNNPLINQLISNYKSMKLILIVMFISTNTILFIIK